MKMQFKRNIFNMLLKRINSPNHFIQVLSGPRQVGKTELVNQIALEVKFQTIYASADDPTLQSLAWLEQQWERARALIDGGEAEALLILDEVQKIEEWSSVVKKLWDEDKRKKRELKVILLGSAPLQIQSGLSESLAGRFEVVRATHWSLPEMETAFKITPEQYIFFGGYPASAALLDDELRWRSYIRESLIETTISRDILLLSKIEKPALLRRLFQLGCEYSGKILSYQKMIGQLQDTGNTTTIANYLQLLENAGLLAGLEKFSGEKVRQRSSSPKFQVLNNALMTSDLNDDFAEAKANPELWGHLVESAIGAYIYNAGFINQFETFYWREGNYEVDFVLVRRGKIVAIEVKSGKKRESLPGISEFSKHYKNARLLLVGKGGIPVEEFLRLDLMTLF